VDRVRELGWPGVLGNTGEMLVQPESLEEHAAARSWSTATSTAPISAI
jgi:hypothetical protein